MTRIFFLFLAFLLTCNIAFSQNKGEKVVTLDNYYNHEVNKEGKVWHYTWDDNSNGGFLQLGELFEQAGGTLKTLAVKPDKTNLKGSKIYIIVDPDTKAETSSPNFMDEQAASDIMAWVKKGGRLVLFTNDKGNCDLEKINILSQKAGIHFNENSVSNERPYKPGERFFDDCAFTKFTNHPIFKDVKKIFLKGICTIECTKGARGILMTEKGEIIMAQAKVGKGIVLAITDPWLYNEYIGHILLPNDFTNETAATNLVNWLLKK